MYTFIQTETEALKALNYIEQYDGLIDLDIETTGLDYFSDKIVLVQVAVGSTIFIFDTRELPSTVLFNIVNTLACKTCRLHNAKFDMKFLYNATKVMLPNVYCTMVAETIIHAGIKGVPLGLKDLVEKYLGIEMEKESRNEFIDLPDTSPITEQMLIYSAMDVKVLGEIYNTQRKEIEAMRGVRVVELEMKLLPIVAKMEYTGIPLDPDKWSKLEALNRAKLATLSSDFKTYCIDKITESKHFKTGMTAMDLADKMSIPVKTKKLRNYLEEITDLTNLKGWLHENFNTASPNQMLAVLKILGVKVNNTNAKTLEMIPDKPEVITRLLEIREVAKQVSTYGTSFLENIHPYTGKVHTEYLTTGTRTGRFSSKEPNLQNIPTHGGFRECFVPSPGYVFMSVDYSQQEYRLAGAVSRDPVIIDAYKNNFDMHTATAANFFGKEKKDVTKDERSWGKTRNFEIIYGTTEYGLSRSLKSSIEHARDVLEKYWAGYPTLYAFKLTVEKKILELGYSCTPFGRRRYNTPKPMFMTSKEFMQWQSQVLREGFNFIIQGGGADILKIAMLSIDEKNPFGDKLRMLLQIHDELMLEVHESIVKEAEEFIMEEMRRAEQPFLGEIPAVVESKISKEWSK